MTKSSHGECAQGMANRGNQGVYKTRFMSPDTKAGVFPVPNIGVTQLFFCNPQQILPVGDGTLQKAGSLDPPASLKAP